MDALKNYYEEIIDHYESLTRLFRDKRDKALNHSSDDEAIEKARSLYEQGYRLRVDFNLAYSVEMTEHSITPTITILGFEAKRPGEDSEYFEMEILWLGQICQLQAGDVSRVFAEEFSTRLSGGHSNEPDHAVSPPNWLRELTKEIISGQDHDDFRHGFANDVLFYLHVLSEHTTE